MRRNAKRLVVSLAVCIGMLACARPVSAAGIDDFQLTRAIPADAAMAVHARDHEGLAFLKKQTERVWAAVEAQHFEKDIRTLMKGMVQQDGGDPEEFEQWWQQLNDLLLAVEWSTLCEHEFAFAMKMGFPAPDLIFLGQSSPEKAKSNFEGLEAILKTLAGYAPEGELVVTTQGEGDSVVHTIGFANAPFPVGELMLAREKNAILIGFGQVMPEQALALLRGEEGQALKATERFQGAMKRLPPPTDEFFYMDMTRFLGQVRAVCDAGMSMADPTGEGIDEKSRALPAKLIDTFDIFDTIAEVSTTDGLKTTSDSVAMLRDDAKSKPMYAVMFKNGPVKKPLKFIPKTAQNFSVWSGICLPALYEGVIAFIGENVPGGEEMIAEWDEMKVTLPIDVEKDLLSWIGGGFASFSMPAKSAYQPGPWALMLSVTDDAKAQEMLGRLYAEVEPLLKENSGMLRDAEIEGAEGFKIIIHPMLAMMGGLSQPTLGVKDGQLFVGSSPEAIGSALATAAGDAPDFSSNERFQKEGLPVGKNVTAMSFADLTKLGEELGQALSMVPMIGMFVPEVAQNPMGRALITAAGKAGKVVRELNFLQSSCSQTTVTGQVVYTKAVTNYREPPKPKPAATEPAEPAEEKSPGEDTDSGEA